MSPSQIKGTGIRWKHHIRRGGDVAGGAIGINNMNETKIRRTII